jgi:hypothetical protein
MSTHKARRASVNRQLRSLANTEHTSQVLRPVEQRSIYESPYKATLSHMRPATRYGWRSHVPLAHDDERMSKRAKEIIESFELYRLHAQYTQQESYTLGKWLRQYQRKRLDYTQAVRQEVLAWYTAHGHERIQRMRKQHAIVGTDKRTILRTA